MDFDFNPYFRRYEQLVQSVDTAFQKVQQQFPSQVTCHIGCADCCYALFDVTLIEGLYINRRFRKEVSEERREAHLEKCNRADRQVYKLKKQAYRRLEEGRPEDELLAEMAAERVRCPFLNDLDRCDIYECRPITCRLYGIPTAIGGKGHSCGRCAFEVGVPYPTVNMDAIHQKLHAISTDLIAKLDTPYVKLNEVLVPLSMAILTDYDEDYFGLKQTDPAGLSKC